MQLDFQKQLLAARGDTKDKHSLVYVEGEGKDGYIGLAVVGAPKVDKKEIKQAESFVKGQ